MACIFISFIDSVLNAGLDLIFLGILHFGIVCSAVMTVLAEVVSALLAAGYLRKKLPELFPGRYAANGGGQHILRIPLLPAELQRREPCFLPESSGEISGILITGLNGDLSNGFIRIQEQP